MNTRISALEAYKMSVILEEVSKRFNIRFVHCFGFFINLKSPIVQPQTRILRQTEAKCRRRGRRADE
jgi:hypothetical protein